MAVETFCPCRLKQEVDLSEFEVMSVNCICFFTALQHRWWRAQNLRRMGKSVPTLTNARAPSVSNVWTPPPGSAWHTVTTISPRFHEMSQVHIVLSHLLNYYCFPLSFNVILFGSGLHWKRALFHLQPRPKPNWKVSKFSEEPKMILDIGHDLILKACILCIQLIT